MGHKAFTRTRISTDTSMSEHSHKKHSHAAPEPLERIGVAIPADLLRKFCLGFAARIFEMMGRAFPAGLYLALQVSVAMWRDHRLDSSPAARQPRAIVTGSTN